MDQVFKGRKICHLDSIQQVIMREFFKVFEIYNDRRQQLILWSLVIISFVTCYYRTFLWLNFKYFSQDSYFSHGYLIPLISAYLIYLKKDELKPIPFSSSCIGLGIILIALAIHILGVAGDINSLSGFSMVMYIGGCSLYFLGSDFTKRIMFPILFLLFMCPIPDAMINVIALPSKSMATTLALKFIDLLGIPYIREGFRIHLPASTFIVGTPCNGMRSLIAFLALGVVSLAFIRTSFLKKVVFLALIPPISIFLNATRIAILLWIANTYGQQAVSPESYLHDGSGLVVFILGLAALFIFYGFISEERKH